MKRGVSEVAPLKDALNEVDNAKLVYDGTNWALDAATPIYYPRDGSVLDFYAYYPYQAGVTQASQITLSTIADQGSAAAYGASDFLSASTLGVDGMNGAAVSLNFAHLMSLVEVVVSNTGTWFSKFTATLESAKRVSAFDLTQNALLTEDEAVGISMFRFSGVVTDPQNTPIIYRALVPAQTITQGKTLFAFTRNEELEVMFVPAAEAWTAGSVNHYTDSLSAVPIARVTYEFLLDGGYISEGGVLSDGLFQYKSVTGFVNAEYAAGDVITLGASANSQYRIANWPDGSDTTYTFTASGIDRVIVANFTSN